MSETPHSAIHAAQYEDVDPQKDKAKGGMVSQTKMVVLAAFKEKDRLPGKWFYVLPCTFPTGSFFPCLCLVFFVFLELLCSGIRPTITLV